MKYFFLTLFVIFINSYLYANNLFETPFYNIEFTSKNIEEDKISEIKKIKFKTIESIFKKTLLDKNVEEINNFLTEDLINTFIKNILINDEKIVNDLYVSKFKINFDKKKIIDFYRKEKFSYIEYYPKKILLIIYEENEFIENLFTRNNVFYNYIQKNIDNHNLFTLPNMDINDRFILKKEDLENRNLDKIRNFSKKYNLNNTAIILIKANEDKFTYELIVYSDGVILEIKEDSKKIELDNFFKKIEHETLNIWKKINSIQNNSLNFLSCKIKYFNMFELKEIRNKIKNISIIENLNVKSLSYKSINYDIYYYGNTKILFKLFQLNNLKVNKYDDICIIRL